MLQTFAISRLYLFSNETKLLGLKVSSFFLQEQVEIFLTLQIPVMLRDLSFYWNWLFPEFLDVAAPGGLEDLPVLCKNQINGIGGLFPKQKFIFLRRCTSLRFWGSSSSCCFLEQNCSNFTSLPEGTSLRFFDIACICYLETFLVLTTTKILELKVFFWRNKSRVL